jgi:hypothetical protein
MFKSNVDGQRGVVRIVLPPPMWSRKHIGDVSGVSSSSIGKMVNSLNGRCYRQEGFFLVTACDTVFKLSNNLSVPLTKANIDRASLRYSVLYS